jgi:molybdopterin-containing oxidoreductase family iron-sulfur binding subunit
MKDSKALKRPEPVTPLAVKDAALPTREESLGLPSEMSRRRLMQLMLGASSALIVGAQGCERKPRRKIVSRAAGPEYQKPGRALYYSSTWTEGSWPYGLVVKTVDGRPVKVDGNPDDPVCRGSSTVAMQASILSLYDPDRLRSPRSGGQELSWGEADRRVVDALRGASTVALLTRSTIGPAERALTETFLAKFQSAHHFVHESVHDMPRRRAWERMYGTNGEWVPRLDRARIVVSLDADFLASDGVVLENIRAFAGGRAVDDRNHRRAEISRLYVMESAMTLTGSNADHRIRLRPSAMAAVANALRRAVAGSDAELRSLTAEHHLDEGTLSALVHDLRSHAGEALVLAGAHLPAAVHAAVGLLNDELGAAGRTLEWNASPGALPVSDPAEMRAVLEAGVDVLISFAVNPVYDWPEGDFAGLIAKAGLSVGHGMHLDETQSACAMALASSHNLESWNDAAPRNGARTLCQPVIAPLFDTRQEADSLLRWTQALAERDDPIRQLEDWHAYLQQRWVGRLAGDGVQRDEAALQVAWEESLRTGGAMTHVASAPPVLDRDAAERIAATPLKGGDHELVILAHHAVHDGRFANSAWLQELPDPVSKLVWDNAAALSPATATALGVVEGDLLTVEVGGQSVPLPALLQPGMADGVVATTLGYGRAEGGHVAREAGGTNVAPLLGQEDSAAPRMAMRAVVRKAGGTRTLVRTQKQFSMHGRPIVMDGDLDEYRHEADFVKHKRHLPEPVDLYEPYDYSKGHKWGMAIDLAACVGCGACTAACQAENNIPIVGRDECSLGREMHWIRIDRYHEGDPDNPTVHHQPMTCQHCDNAPCENVCPVNATSHSPEGLNEMTYNRCVGTRYCANNCPYKVRRYNFYRYQEAQVRDSVQELAFNPQVTVRGVGVMEKCTFCVQRINAAKFSAQNDDRQLVDGDVQPACQQACPAQAIVFGDANDPESRLAAQTASGRAFRVLEELNVKPNITYLARVRNPNPKVRREADSPDEGHGA